MRHAFQRIGSIRLPIAAVIATTAIAVMMASPAFAENPLYCNGLAGLNQGCAGPHGLMHRNEGRNQEGGCIVVQIWASDYGYTTPFEECGGNVAVQALTVHTESFDKCWNGSSLSVIHCRYELWGT
jgi:hypothetical protein